MVSISKYDLLIELSKIDDLIFVGGTSEYIRGIKNELRDIDVSVSNVEFLKKFGYVHTHFDNSFHGLSGKRGIIPTKNTIIDIFIDEKRPCFENVNGFKCETVDSMINLREKTIKDGNLKGYHLDKLKNNLNRLIEWKQLQ